MKQYKTETTCRICLNPPKTRSKFISVHNNYKHSKENQTFAELFRQTTGFHIEAREPQFLCTDCRLKLVKCFQFIQQCKNTQENLRSLTASTANHREIKIYYEEEIFPYVVDCNEAYDQNFGCNEIANEPGELIVEHELPEATVAPCTPGMNDPDEQSSSCSDSRNETDEITIEEPKLATNSNDELIVELVVAENREVPDMRGIEEVSMAEPTISVNDLELKENEFVCILGPDPIEDVTESQDFKATDNRFACDQCIENSCVFESKKKLIAHKYRVHKKTVRCCSCKKYFRLDHFEHHKVFCSLILKNKRTTNSMKRSRRDHPEHKIKCQKSSKRTVKIKRLASKKLNRPCPTLESCEIEKPIPNACSDVNETDSAQPQKLVIGLEPMRNGYFCDYCKDNSRFYKSKSALLTHMSTHLQKSPCRFCNEGYTLDEFDQHTAKCELNPTSENYLKCKHCGHEKTLKNRRQLKRHIRLYHKSSVLCTECGNIFNKNYIDIHIEAVHKKQNKFICDLCPEKSYTTKQYLIDHMNRKHAKNRKLVICKICGEGYKTADLLKAHRGKMHSDLYPLYKCSYCSYTTPFARNGKRHEILHLRDAGKLVHGDYSDRHIEVFHENSERFTCDLCPATSYSKKGTLKQHMDRIHLKTKPRKQIYSSVQCNECGKCYDKLYIDQHMKAVHKIDSKFICDLCPDKSFILKQSIIDHMTFNHIKNLKFCTICYEGFRETRHLDTHQRTAHTDQYPFYKCSHCEYKTPNKELLQIHELRHLGDTEKKYECRTCGKKFLKKSQLDQHLLSHADENSVICDICNQGFKANLYLKRHLHRVHLGEKKFECPVCQKKFQKNQDNRSHIEKHHPEYELPPPGTVLKKNSKVKMSKVTRVNPAQKRSHLKAHRIAKC